MFWLHCEDLCAALVGPFNTMDEADAHRNFCIERGDCAKMTILPSNKKFEYPYHFEMTPEEDRGGGPK